LGYIFLCDGAFTLAGFGYSSTFLLMFAKDVHLWITDKSRQKISLHTCRTKDRPMASYSQEVYNSVCGDLMAQNMLFP
jgi:hypothetical protein